MTEPTIDQALARLDEMITRLDQQGRRLAVMTPEFRASGEFQTLLDDYARNSETVRGTMREMLGHLL